MKPPFTRYELEDLAERARACAEDLRIGSTTHTLHKQLARTCESLARLAPDVSGIGTTARLEAVLGAGDLEPVPTPAELEAAAPAAPPRLALVPEPRPIVDTSTMPVEAALDEIARMDLDQGTAALGFELGLETPRTAVMQAIVERFPSLADAALEGEPESAPAAAAGAPGSDDAPAPAELGSADKEYFRFNCPACDNGFAYETTKPAKTSCPKCGAPWPTMPPTGNPA